MKYCRWCKQSKPLDAFYLHPRMADGHLNKCQDCVKAYAQHRRLTSDRPREIDNRRYREGKKGSAFSATHPHRAKMSAWASQIVRRAVQTGTLVKASACEWCGSTAALEGAHWDYTKPLQVLWLCRRCHC
jgi:hypothetical protein